MSGICGFLHRDGRPAQQSSLDRMTAALAAYGPDGQAARTDGPFACARLLRRSLPEDAHDGQPLLGGGGRYLLVADCRIDNRAELARALAIGDAEARRLSDADFVLRTYERWQQDSFARLVGDFALVLWNAADRSLTCALDPLAGRSLFFHLSPRLFAFASAPRGLHALGIPRRLNQAKVVEALALFPSSRETTYYEDVSRVLPGEALTLRPSGAGRRRFWEVPQNSLRLKGDGEYAEAARVLLDDAVRCRLRSSRPVGAMMSAGLDSSSVACLAARQLGAAAETLPVFTHVPLAGFTAPLGPRRFGDESALVECVRRHQPGIDVTYVRAEGKQLFEGYEAHHRAAEAPVFDAFNHLWVEAIFEEAHERGIGVLLTGQRGNLTLSWHGRLPSQLGAAPRLLVRLGLAHWRLYPSRLALLRERSCLQPALLEQKRLDERLRRFGIEAEARALLDQRRARYAALIAIGSNHGASPWEERFGIERRDPTADRRIVEFCLAVPRDQFSREGRSRTLIRRAMAGIVPEPVLSNENRGRQSADWVERLLAARGLPEMLRDLERSPAVTTILDISRLKTDVARLAERPVDIPLRSRVGRGVAIGLFLRGFERDGAAASHLRSTRG